MALASNGKFHYLRGGIEETARRHPGEAGIIVYAAYRRLRLLQNKLGWGAFAIRINGEVRGAFTDAKRGPRWFPCPEGENLLEVGAELGRIVFRANLHLGASEALAIVVKPVDSWPLYRDWQPFFELLEIRKPSA